MDIVKTLVFCLLTAGLSACGGGGGNDGNNGASSEKSFSSSITASSNSSSISSTSSTLSSSAISSPSPSPVLSSSSVSSTSPILSSSSSIASSSSVLSSSSASSTSPILSSSAISRSSSTLSSSSTSSASSILSSSSSSTLNSSSISSSSSILSSSSTSNSSSTLKSSSSSTLNTSSIASSSSVLSSSSSSILSSSSTLRSSSISSSSLSSSSSSSLSSSSISSSVLSSSSSSSIKTQNVFIDQLDSAWKEISAWETTKDRSVSADYSDGTQGQLINWTTPISNDPEHDKVIDVKFSNNTNYNGLFHITTVSANGKDMSEFATGKLVFDIKLINAGNFEPSLDVLIECVYPCTSHTIPLTISASNQWITQEIAIADLIDSGLDISKINMAFEILPTWDKQTGVNFQLDNIRWVKGTTPVPVVAAPCYREPFETWGILYHFDWLAGSPNVLANGLLQIIAESKLYPNWSTIGDKFAYGIQVRNTFAACSFIDGSLSAQIYVAKSYVDDGNMKVGFYYEDSNQRRAYFAPISASTLKADGWTIISSGLSDYNGIALSPFASVDTSFNANNIMYVGVYVDANGKVPSVKGEINIDNIVIK